MNKSCVFCDIVNKKNDSYVVYENKIVMAILDIDPINEGHILLITKKPWTVINKINITVSGIKYLIGTTFVS